MALTIPYPPSLLCGVAEPVGPLLQDSGLSLACGMAGFVMLSFLCWTSGRRMPVSRAAIAEPDQRS